jgi:medium-chain acyl-[acyl-carrier-protein] hydrolase
VHAATQALSPYLDKPFGFFGHSMGAIISFEVSRLLRREYGRQPAYIFVSGRRAPQIPCAGPITHNLATPAFIEELRRLNGTPGEVIENPELMKLMLPIIRADFEVCETYDYIPEPPLNCPIAAFGGLQDEDVSIGHLEGWRLQTTGPFSLHLFRGDHFYLHRSQSLLIKAISQELLRCNKADKPETVAQFGSPHKSVQSTSTAEA